jgi:hypothetical protein
MVVGLMAGKNIWGQVFSKKGLADALKEKG